MKITLYKAELLYRKWLITQELSSYPEYENFNEFLESLKENGYIIKGDDLNGY